MMKWWVHTRLEAVTMVLLLLGAGAGCAAHSETSASRQEIDDLKGTIERLNERVAQLEGQGSTPPAAGSEVPAAAPGLVTGAPPVGEGSAALPERWQNLTYGMSFEQVDALLGRPQGTIDESPKTVWYYSYPNLGNGSVVFVGESGVTDWQAPPFGNWLWWP
jgi:hypothetical protein